MIDVIFLFLYFFYSKKNFYFWCCPIPKHNFLELIKIKTTLNFDLNYIGKQKFLDYFIRDKKKYKTYILSLDVAAIS